MDIRRRLFLSVILVGLNFFSFGQEVNDLTWYFGTTGNGIRFNLRDRVPELLNNNVGLGTGGSAVAISQADGQVMFYTDGVNVYDVNHLFMPNGTGLNGNPSSSTPVVVSNVPGQPNQYYIFTNSATPNSPGTISYSIVDMEEFGNALFPLPATGDVLSKNTTISPILSNLSQAMVIVPNGNCDGFWLITQESGTDSYHVLEVAESGLTNITTYGGLGLPIEAASFAYHMETAKIAVAPEDNENNVVILDFDPATGALSFDASVLNSGRATTSDEAVYDVEWSTNGNYLYISQIGETGLEAELLQYDVLQPTNTLETVLPNPIHRSYGLKYAPDSSIYHLFQETANGPFLMGKLSFTDSIADKTTYDISPLGVGEYNAKNFSSSLPLYEPNFELAFEVSGTCSNVPSIFMPEIFPSPDSVIWDFGNGDFSNQLSPVYTYQQGGAMSVNLLAFKDGKPDTLNKAINITQFDLQLTLVQDTVACKCELPVNSSAPECAGATDFFEVTAQISGGTPTSVIWSNGDTGEILTPDSAGYYYVVVTDVTGCQAYAGVTVREYGEIDQRANIWYFGQNAGIDFNEQPQVALDDSQMNAPEGCTAISDRNGQIIFYTDGQEVYNRKHVNVTPPGGLGGDPGASQSALVMPFPNDESLYYIFTTQEVYGTGTYNMKYSIFDLKLNTGDGGIMQSNITLFSRSTERIAGINNLIIAHEYGNRTFRTYSITANGISVPVLSEIGSEHKFSNESYGQGYMKISPRGKLAVAVSDAGTSNVIDLFDLNNATGEITNHQMLDLEEAGGQVYGIEFSPGGNKLFSTVLGPPSFFIEHFIDSIGVAYLRQKVPIADQAGAIQVSPTGQVLVAIQGSSSLGTIFPIEDTTRTSTYISNGFQLAAGTSSTLGLPSFTQNIASPLRTPGIQVTGLCLGDTTMLAATGTDIIDEYTWFFGDNTSEIGQNVEHLYASPGVYNVAVQITNRCGLDTTLTRQITISDIPPLPIVPETLALCDVDGEILMAADPNDPEFSNYTFLWGNGETTNQIIVTEPAILEVTITNAAGCTSMASVFISDQRPAVDLGNDQTVCEGQPVLSLDALNTGADFEWRINGVVAGTSQTISVDTSVPGIFEYSVTVTNPITTCVVTDSKTYTVVEIPDFTVNVVNSPGCNENDGEININITSAGSFSYFINGPDFRNGINQIGPTTISEANFAPGTYFVSIQDEVSNCLITQPVTVADVGATMVLPTPTSNPGCTEVSVNVDIGGTYDGSQGFNYILQNLDNISQITGFTPIEPFDTDLVIPGNYSLSIEDIATTCIQTIAPFVVTESPQAALTVQRPDNCTEILIASTDATNPVYTWTGPNGFTGSGASITAPESGAYTVTVSDNSNIQCPATQTISAIIAPFEPEIVQSGDECSGQVQLTAQPATGNYTYTWTGPQTGGANLIVNAANSGTYRVRISNTDTGCSKLSDPLEVTVVDPVSVTLTTSLACDDGNPFTLTATALGGVNYTWFKDDIQIQDETSSTLSSLEGGRFRVLVANEGCTAQDRINVTLAPFSEPDLPNRVSICDDPDNPNPNTKEITFDAGSIFVDFTWKLDNTEVGYQRRYTARESGLYTVDLINAYGCPAIDTVQVVTECDPIINAPNAFSPNGNASNEEFYIFQTFVDDDFDIKLYTRWGELIFQSSDKAFRWNGGYQNNLSKPVPGGTYVYVIKYRSAYQPEKGLLEKRGGVVLLR